MTTDLKPNVALLLKQLEWATAEHEKELRGEDSEWNQGNWCGTACCIAGHTVLDTGWTFETFGDGEYTSFAVKGSEVKNVEAIAREALGLTEDQCSELFSGSNDIEDLWTIAAGISDGEIEIPASIA